jgi:phenylalanyl-tRNA synthetase beta chain
MTVTIEAPELCPAFGIRVIRGVKNGPSPEWLQKRLRAIGLRPINALVDITNLLTLRPLAPAACLRCGEGEGRSRRAPRGKRARSCSRSTARYYALDDTICVISDDRAVESLAGVMGGEESGVSTNPRPTSWSNPRSGIR